jgi:hypothetical protein
MRVLRPALTALFVALAFNAMAAANSFAEELFLTASGKTLLFIGLGRNPVLRALQAGVPAELSCEKVLIHGFILNKSPLAHLLPLLFEGKCVQKINGGANETCGEHITTKPVLVELGLLVLLNPHPVVISLEPSEGAAEFFKLKCGSHETTLGGQVIGEIPETNEKGEKQIGTSRESLEVVFATVAKNNEQKWKSIFLLKELMTKELKIEGFLGGPVSEETTMELKSDGPVTICIHP